MRFPWWPILCCWSIPALVSASQPGPPNIEGSNSSAALLLARAETRLHAGAGHAALRDWHSAIQGLRDRADTDTSLPGLLIRAGALGLRLDELDATAPLLTRALELAQSRVSGSAQVADAADALGDLQWLQSSEDQGLALHQKALQIRQALQPGEIAEASTLRGIGASLQGLSRLSEARTALDGSLAILRRAAPGSLELARCASILGVVVAQSGRVDEAESLWNEALRIRTRTAPRSPECSETWLQLAVLNINQRRVDGASDCCRQALLILKSLPLARRLARCHYLLAAVAEARARPKDAVGWLRGRVTTLSGSGYRREWAEASYDLGLMLVHLGDGRGATEVLRPALAHLAQAEPGSRMWGRTRLQLAEAVLLDQARSSVEEAATLLDPILTSRTNPPLTADEFSQALTARAGSHRRLGEFAAARTLHTQALEIRRRMAARAPNQETTAMAASLHNLGIVELDSGNIPGAATFLTDALEMHRRLKSPPAAIAQTATVLAGVVRQSGEIGRAKLLLEECLSLTALPEVPAGLRVDALTQLGNLHQSLGELQRAVRLAQEGLELSVRLREGEARRMALSANMAELLRQQGDLAGAMHILAAIRRRQTAVDARSPGLATTLTTIANVAADAGDLRSARDALEEALRIRKSRPGNSPELAGVLGNLGRIAWIQGEFDEAERNYREALAIFQELVPGGSGVANTWNNLGQVALDRGDLAAAREAQQSALELIRKAAPQSYEAAVILHDLAHVDQRQNRLDEAEAHSREAWEIIRRRAASVVGDRERQAYERGVRTFSGLLSGILIRRGQVEQALEVVEQGRAQALAQIVSQRGMLERYAPRDLVERFRVADRRQATVAERAARLMSAESAARDRLNRLAGGPPDQSEQARREFEALASERRRTEEEATAARLASSGLLRELQSRVQGIETAVQRTLSLPSGTLALVYSVGPDRVHLFIVSSSGPVHALALELTGQQLAELVGSARAYLAGWRVEVRGTTVRRPAADAARIAGRAAMEKLGTMLLPVGIRDRIARSARLVVSPDGALWDLPFSALVPQGGKIPLGLSKPLSYTPSLALYAGGVGRDLRSLRPGDTLIVGDPDEGTMSSRRAVASAAAAPPSLDGPLPRLAWARDEARAVAALYRAQPSVGAVPTEAWVRERLSGATVIHLATHGFFHPVQGMSSGVRLAKVSRTAVPARDGVLQAWEIAGLRLRAELVVLSACETGLGESAPGEGLIGLTRAFQMAGARKVIASQWAVDDRSTRVLMVTLHRRLRAGAPVDVALQQAMQETARTFPSPRYWAAFCLISTQSRR